MEEFGQDESRARINILRKQIAMLKECFLVEIKYFNDEKTSRLCRNSLRSLDELEKFLKESKIKEEKTWQENARYFLV